MSLLSGYREKDAVRIEPIYAEDRDYNTFLTFRITYRSGESRGFGNGHTPGNAENDWNIAREQSRMQPHPALRMVKWLPDKLARRGIARKAASRSRV